VRGFRGEALRGLVQKRMQACYNMREVSIVMNDIA